MHNPFEGEMDSFDNFNLSMLGFLIRFAVSVVFFGVVVAWYFIPDSFFIQHTEASEKYTMQKKEPKKEIKKVDIKKQESQVKQKSEKVKMKHSVPFIVQAPHAQWDDPMYQDACEEASMVMAGAWLNNDGHVSKNAAEEEIEKVFVMEKEIFGDVVDTSIKDTATIFEKYYEHMAQVKEGISMKDMYDFLAEGYIIIAPTNGKRLENPHFTNGGPERHMLVIIGFDKKNGEFITNDPGTRVGRGYKYKDSTLYNAIRDYNTGNKKNITNSGKNVMIIKK